VYTIAPQSVTVAAAGGPGTVALTATAGCGWAAGSNVPWIIVAPGTGGAGSGTVSYTVLPNTTGVDRTGSLSIASLPFVVTQSR
jgi:hypothetical protein